MKLFITAFLFICANVLFAQNVTIPDANFKAALVANTSINTNMDGEIQVSEAEAFTGSIAVSSLGISDLTGIEAFTAITGLNCASNNLTSLDVSANTTLTSLQFSYNQLTSLDVSANIALTYLECEENQLTAMDVSNNTSLTSLHCSQNELISLNVSGLGDLEALSCGYNQLTTLDISTNSALTNLYVRNNALTVLDVSANPALISIECAENQLTSLDVSNNPALFSLGCNRNELYYLNVRNGNNENISEFNFRATDNTFLFCIEVDDPVYADTTWTQVDSWVSFETNCSLGPIDLGDSLFVMTAYPFNSQDTYIHEGAPDQNFNLDFRKIYLHFGGDFGSGSQGLLISFDLSDLSSAAIDTARIDFFSQGINGTLTESEYGVYRVVEEWIDDSVTWNSRPQIDSIPISVVQGTELAAISNAWMSFGCPPSVVQEWVDTPSQNFGVMILPVGDNPSFHGAPTIISSERESSLDFHPRLVINSQGVKFKGRITDQSTSENLDGLVVSAINTLNNSVSRDTTDLDGNYLLDVRFPGAYDLKVDGSTGYLPFLLDSVAIGEDIALTMDFEMIPEANAIGGVVSGTWSQANSPYIIADDIVVPVGESLIIEPGVKVQFAGRYKLEINGSLEAIGTETDSIRFTSYDTTAYPRGQGIRFVDADKAQSTLSYCVIEHGLADDGLYGSVSDDFGGGVYSRGSKVLLEHCDIRHNTAFSGGGVYIAAYGPPVIIRENLIRNNLATRGGFIETGGGGITVMGSDSVLVESNIIIDNSYNGISGPNREGGGGVRLQGDVYFVNNLVYGNHAIKGSGLLIQRRGRVYNNIVWNNSGASNGEQLAIQIYDGETEFQPDLQIHYNNIQDPIVVLNRESPAGFDYTSGVGNIDVDPQFADSLNRDFRLMPDSPLIDAGNSAIYDSLAYYYHFDYDGNDRLFEVFSVTDSGTGDQPLPDIGPYEYLSIKKLGDLTATFLLPSKQTELMWTDHSTNETGFIVERSDYPDTLFTVIDTLASGVVTHTEDPPFFLDTLYYRVRSTTAAGFNSYAYTYVVNNDNTSDSLVLVDLYNATNGPEWANNAGWLSDSLKNWYGVTLGNNRVTELMLVGNQLDGTVPPELGNLSKLRLLMLSSNQLNGMIPLELNNLENLTELDLSNNVLAGSIPSELGSMVHLRQLNLSGNELSGQVPASFLDLTQLESLEIQNNDLDSLPDLSGLPNLGNLRIYGNKFMFDDVEPYPGLLGLVLAYAPQQVVGEELDTLLSIADSIILQALVDGTGVLYTWYKDNTIVPGENTSTLVLDNVDFTDEGSYHFEATSSAVPDMTLVGALKIIRVSSLQRDSLVLRSLYMATNGSEWLDAENWDTSSLENWEGVSVENSRVVALDISGKNVSGGIPDGITDILNLVSVNLSDNDILSIPDMTSLDQLISLDVSGNRLEFDDLEPNISITGFQYADQKKVGEEFSRVLPHGDNFELSVEVGGTANQYQWYFVSDADEPVEVDGATDSVYLMSGINYDKMGSYMVRVTSGLVDNLTLESFPIELLASANLEFVGIGKEGALISEGYGYALKVTEPGTPFDSVALVTPTDGVFGFNDLILGDYLVAFEADAATYIPTYYRNTDLWAEADTLRLRADRRDTLYMTLKPEPWTPDDGDGVVTGFVETNFSEDPEGRIDARRKVKKAGCSLRRRTRSGGGREDQAEDEFVLVAYVETNDEGAFEFQNIPSGYYRFNIEYPGIPMDTASFVEFEIGEDGIENNTFKLEAFVTENGIEVIKIDELGFRRKYFRDLSVYPNPVDHELIIRYKDLISESVKVKIMDMTGKVVNEQSVQSGKQKAIRFDVSQLQNGLYFIRFVDVASGLKSIAAYKVFVEH